MLGNAIVGLLILGAIVGAYSGGWHRGKNGLGLWPFSVGKSGIHRQPVLLLSLLTAASGTFVACSAEYRTPAKPPADTTTAARPDSQHHDGDADHHDGEHHDGDGQHGDQHHGKKKP